MEQQITITGLVATTPRHLTTTDGLPITSFRLASTDNARGETNWFTITCFHDLAKNAEKSVNKGERIMVAGKIVVRDWDNGERSGTSVEIEADAIGHDLSWGTSLFTRNVLVRETPRPTSPRTALHPEPEMV